MLGENGLVLLARHKQALMDLVRVLAEGQERTLTAQLHLSVAPGKAARSKLLLEAEPPRSEPLVVPKTA